MNKIFDSVIFNLKTDTRSVFYNLLKTHLINKKTCNKFAKYLKINNFKSKVLELCYCRQLNITNLNKREYEKLKKFFKKTNYIIINDFLDNKLKYIKYLNLLNDLYSKFQPVFKNYLNRNNFKYTYLFMLRYIF